MYGYESLLFLPIFFFCCQALSEITIIRSVSVLEAPNTKHIPPCFRLPESKTAIQNMMGSNSILLGGVGWSLVGQHYNDVHVTPEIEAMLTSEGAILEEGDLIGLNKNCKGTTVESPITALRMGGTNWCLSGLYGWFDRRMQLIWDVMDLMLGQFMLTPVAAYSEVSWSQRMPKGVISSDSPQCKLMEGFQDTLVGLDTRSIFVSAGATSYSCENADLARQITNALSNPGSESVDFFCDGKDWNVGICGDGVEISIGDHTEKDVGNCEADLTIRPCIGNYNWGGLNGGCEQDTIILSVVVYYGTSFAPTPYPSYLPTTSANPTETPTNEPTDMPIEFPTAAPSAMQTEIYNSTDETNVLNDFDRIDKDGDGVLSYVEIIFDIADVNKDGDISSDEYLAARANGLLRDTSA